VGHGKGIRILLGLEGLKKITLGGDMGMKADRYIRYIGESGGGGGDAPEWIGDC
jgi:hypothetical protein